MTTQAPIKILSIDILFVAMALMACRYWIRRAELAHRYKKYGRICRNKQRQQIQKQSKVSAQAQLMSLLSAVVNIEGHIAFGCVLQGKLSACSMPVYSVVKRLGHE